jgi:hypothetical protein
VTGGLLDLHCKLCGTVCTWMLGEEALKELLDAGFLSCTLASIRLSPKPIHANHCFSTFLACVELFFDYTIDV